MSQNSALISARNSVLRKLFVSADAWRDSGGDWENPQAVLALADSLDARIRALVTGVDLLRHEALRAIEARKGAAA